MRNTKFPSQEKKTRLSYEQHPLCREIHVYIHRPPRPNRVTLTLHPQKCTTHSQIPLQGVTMPTTIYSTALQSTPKQLCLNIFHYIVTGCNPSSFYSSVLSNTIHSSNPLRYNHFSYRTIYRVLSCLSPPSKSTRLPTSFISLSVTEAPYNGSNASICTE